MLNGDVALLVLSSCLLFPHGSWPCPHSLFATLLVSFSCSPKIFQKTKCSICNSALELPSVHFLCGHSFHQHCFESYSESDADCPTCLPENRKVMDMIRAQEQKRDLHDQFQHQVCVCGGGWPRDCPTHWEAGSAGGLLVCFFLLWVLTRTFSLSPAQVLQRQLLCDC